jgi:hypothetical protein
LRINRKLIKGPGYSELVLEPKDKVITCDYGGRFANNLFQIGTVLSYAQKNGFQTVFPEWPYSRIFDWDLKFDNVERNSFDWKTYNERRFAYKGIPLLGPLKIVGWFQSWKHLNQNLILETFKFKPEFTTLLESKYARYLGCRLTSIHVRRTDYVGNGMYYQIPISYYQKNMTLLDSETDFFLVFSDDIIWCKQNLYNDKIVYIENGQDYEDFILTSLCQHNITANSTFSWWSAYLNKNPEKKVIVPPRWFNNSDYGCLEDLYHPSWVIGDV